MRDEKDVHQALLSLYLRLLLRKSGSAAILIIALLFGKESKQ
jgi:hypothetical protein